MSVAEPKLTSIRITAEREIARRRDLLALYRELMGESDRLRDMAGRIRLLINDDISLNGDTISKPESQLVTDTVRTLKSVVANLEKRSIAANLDDVA